MERKRFLIAGGDRRFLRLGQLLEEDGHSVRYLALQEEGWPDREWEAAASQADCAVLPIPPAEVGGMLTAPLSRRRVPLEKLLGCFRAGQMVCSGGITGELERAAEARGFRLVDYLDREELTVENAVSTAEGAISAAMQELPCTIHGTKTLVIGCGKCGYALARRLSGLGAELTVSARSWRDFARIRAEGWRQADTGELERALPRMRLVFNTVPARVLGAERLKLLPRNGLIIDLASRPGGVDWEAAEELGIKAIHALGIPGKYAPETAAESLRTVVYHCIQECER